MKRSAKISKCGKYRYELRRVWEASKPKVLFIGLNPSTADSESEDNTSRVCIGYAKRWGYGTLILANLFAFRSTCPDGLKKVKDPIGPRNDFHLRKLIEESNMVVCAWSGLGKLMDRDQEVKKLVNDPYCLTILKDGTPGHPLYKKRDLKPIPLLTRKTQKNPQENS